MSDERRNKELVESFVNEVFIKHDMSHLERFLRKDYIQHNPDVPQGREGFKQFFETCFQGVPDFSYTLKKIVAEDDLVFIYCTTTGTHKGVWIGMAGTGNKLDFDVVDMFRIQDGLIAEHWDVADTLKLFTTIGKAKVV
ncbi:MAG: ester cyclase [Syntrophorhabdales bacterium]|jgi:predicted SnoaL-like aldol condensation-catalyzing enzyme